MEAIQQIFQFDINIIIILTNTTYFCTQNAYIENVLYLFLIIY